MGVVRVVVITTTTTTTTTTTSNNNNNNDVPRDLVLSIRFALQALLVGLFVATFYGRETARRSVSHFIGLYAI